MKKPISKKSNKQIKTAFTLIEMSIVILVASILITGLLSASVGSITNSNIKLTNDRMREIYKSLGNFVAVKGRLPCPASLRKAKSVDSDYGAEVRADGGGSDICVAGSDVGVYESNGANGRLVYGAVPVKALGLASEMAEDGFGNKLVYVMNQDFAGGFANPVDFSAESFSVASNTALVAEENDPQDPGGVFTIQEKYGASTATASAYAIMALISYGPNKSGAFNANAAQPNPSSADADEQSNYPSSYSTTTAAFDDAFISESDSSDVFDDIVQFKTVKNFVEDFSLMFLMPCKNATGTGFAGTQDAYYGQNVYGSDCTPAINGNYTKRCEAYGRWVDTNVCP